MNKINSNETSSPDIRKHAYEQLMSKSEEIKLSTKELTSRKDIDLVIEGNTVYEIDYECVNGKGKCYKNIE